MVLDPAFPGAEAAVVVVVVDVVVTPGAAVVVTAGVVAPVDPVVGTSTWII